MNRVILQLFAVGFCFAAVQALQCYQCDIGFWTLCLTSKTTCPPNQQCFNGVGKAAKFVDVMMKGCLETAKCNQTQDVTFGPVGNATVYKMTKTCCGSDFCNAAPGLPVASELSLVLTAIAALFVVNVLV